MTADPTEVRQWARDNGIAVNERGRLAADVVAEYEAAHPVDEQDDGEAPLVVALPEMPSPASGTQAPESPAAPESAPSPGARREEIKPAGRKVSAAERFRQRVGTTAPKAKRGKRAPLDSLVSWAWGLGGMALMQMPQSTPVGRMLAMQAPVAGVIVDELVADTLVDRILQPLAKGSEKAEKAFALLGPPVLVGILTARPELAPALTPALKVAMLSWAEISEPALKKAEAKAQQMAERLGEVDVDAMIEALFADIPDRGHPSEDEEAAIRRARGDS